MLRVCFMPPNCSSILNHSKRPLLTASNSQTTRHSARLKTAAKADPIPAVVVMEPLFSTFQSLQSCGVQIFGSEPLVPSRRISRPLVSRNMLAVRRRVAVQSRTLESRQKHPHPHPHPWPRDAGVSVHQRSRPCPLRGRSRGSRARR